MTIVRTAARVLIVDESGKILLFKGRDRMAPERGTWWFTVGGGLEEHESHEEAAAREVFEETGLQRPASDFGESVYEDVSRFTFGGESYEQHQKFFVLRTVTFEPAVAGLDSIERDSILGSRWWSAGDLRGTSEIFYPEELAGLLERILAY